MANMLVLRKRAFAMSERATRVLEDLVVSPAALETHSQRHQHLHHPVSEQVEVESGKGSSRPTIPI